MIRMIYGQDCVSIVVVIPLGIPNTEEAIDKAAEGEAPHVPRGAPNTFPGTAGRR